MDRERPDAILMVSDSLTLLNRRRVFEYAAERRLPAIYETDSLAREGGLMSYGPDRREIFERSAALVDRIFKGRWHRAGFRRHLRWKSRNLGGRPQIAVDLRALIRRMSVENLLWGAPRIHGELLKLGFAVAQYMASRRPTSFEMAQQEFNERQMLPQRPEPQPTMQQQQQIQPKKEE